MFGSIFLCLSIAASAATTEKECPTIDHRSRLPPVRHQGSPGWCYANAAADLLSFATGENISSVGLAIQYQLNKAKVDRKDPSQSAIARFFSNVGYDWGISHIKTEEGGTLYAGVEGSKDVGLCRESDLPGRYELWDLGSGNKTQNYSQFVYENLNEWNKTPNAKRGKWTALAPETNSCNSLDSLRRFFPGVRASDFREILGKTRPSEDPVIHLYKKACSNRVAIPPVEPEVKNWNQNERKRLLEYLDAQLKDHPVGVAYNAKILQDPKARGPANHASSIVGRQFRNGQCEYLVRNSWGSDCEDGEYSPEYKCEGGNIWIPADVVEKAVDFTTVLKARAK